MATFALPKKNLCSSIISVIVFNNESTKIQSCQ